MTLRGWKTVNSVVHRIRARISDSVLILGYHRVTESILDPFGICVRPKFFAEQMEVLRRRAHVVGLETLHEGLRGRSLPRNSVAITFDDGYFDVLHTARPLLQKYEVPATAFVSTGALGQEFWWDRLQELIFGPATLPETLQLNLDSKTFSWSILDPESLATHKKASSARNRLLVLLYGPLLAMSADARMSALEQLREWTEARGRPPRPEKARAMTPNELQALADGGLITVGAHSVDHCALPALSPESQNEQIAVCKKTLSDLLQRPVNFFSYPHGAASPTTLQLVRANGFQLACASQAGAVHARSDPYRLPRLWVPDWDGEKFSRWLEGWLR